MISTSMAIAGFHQSIRSSYNSTVLSGQTAVSFHRFAYQHGGDVDVDATMLMYKDAFHQEGSRSEIGIRDEL